MEPKNREKMLMMLAGVCVGLWLLNLVVIGPLIDSWHSRSAEITDLKKRIADGKMLIGRERFVRSRWDSMRTNALPNNPTSAEHELFTAFDQWSSYGGVTEGSFRPQWQPTDTNYATVDCRAEVSGNSRAIESFLKAMTRDPLGVKVESFELTSKDDNGQQLTLGLNLSGLVLQATNQ